MDKNIYRIAGVKKSFEVDGNELRVIEEANITIEENEFVCLVGPSGCGKSTLLRMLAGLDTPTKGTIFFKDHPLCAPTKDIGMVFQNYSLMPWQNVEDNIALGLKFQGVPKVKQKLVIDEYLDIIGLTKFRKSYPHQLSGGMQQRVAIARSLANDPEVVLMDEPFGALDAHTRIQLQKELLRIWENHKKTIIFVTHSVDEAIYLADRIIMMSKDHGKIEADIPVNIPRVRERSDPRYAKLNQALLEKLEVLNEV